MRDIQEGACSVSDIIHWFPKLGIPHFQRGLVWNSESVSLLLESLFSGTPCGILILWQPADLTREGVPLSKKGNLEFLILDGQQRIRSLWETLGPIHNGDDQDEEDDDGQNGPTRAWCLNLERLDRFPSDGSDQSRYRLFTRVRLFPPRDPGFRYNLIPLQLLLDRSLQDLFDKSDTVHRSAWSKIRESDMVRDSAKAWLAADLDNIKQRVSAIYENALFNVRVLREKDGKHNGASVVALYNRINSGGMRVEAEEKAYSRLVSLRPETTKWLRGVFDALHPADGVGGSAIGRDDMLKRQKEKSFGFKLFIRTFIQICSYHFNYEIGAQSFSFKVLDNTQLCKVLGDRCVADDKVEQLFEGTKNVLAFVRDAIVDLGCDTFQMLPDATSLWPAFQLLIRYPSLMDRQDGCGKRVLRALILRLMLAPQLNTRDVLRLVSVVDDSKNAVDCLRLLSADQALHIEKRHLRRSLEQANSLMDRYVLMLYWLLRRNEATDFLCPWLEEMRLKAIEEEVGRRAAPLNAGVDPEKQHVVPYSTLEVLYDIKSRGRISRHGANNIGNLTYISHALNNHRTGLGADALRLGEEKDKENLRNHFLEGGKGLHKLFKDIVEKAASRKGTSRRLFERFCRIRRERIARGFAKWVNEEPLDRILEERVEPDKRRFYDTLEDTVRATNYPDAIKDALYDLVMTKGWGKPEETNGKIKVNWLDKERRKRAWLTLTREGIEVYENAKPKGPVYRALKGHDVTREDRKKDGSIKRYLWTLRVDEEHATQTAEYLRRVASKMAKARA